MIFYRPWQPVKALSFDLDDTLYDNEPIIQRAEAQLLTFLQQFPECQHTDSSFWRKAKNIAVLNNPQLTQDMSQWRQASLEVGLRECGLRGAALTRLAEQAFYEFYRARSDFNVSETVQQTLKILAQQLPLVAITNGNVDVDSIGLSGVFQQVFHARADQPMKPSPIMFERCASALKLPPQQILHVGDNLEKDVWGALQVGFKTAWLAVNRDMDLRQEPAALLPDVQLQDISELLELVSDYPM